MLSVRLNGDLLEVKIESRLGDLEFSHTKRFLNSVPGAQYVPDKYLWLIPKEHVDQLVHAFGDKLAWFNSIEEIKGIEETVLPEFQATDEGLEDMKLRPYPFQIVGASFLHDIKCGVLADDMGVGKTVQAIAAIHRLWKEGKVNKVLVICPSSVKYQWVNEVEKFTYHKAIAIDGSPQQRKQQMEQFAHGDTYLFAITSYELVRNDVDQLREIQVDAIVADEVHRIKNYATKVSQALKQLDAPYKFGLTGTPIQNKADEVYSIFEWINPMVFGTYWGFRRRYVATAEKFGKRNVPIGYKNLGELRRRVGSYMLRRLAKDVAQDLPEIVYNTYRIPMTPEQQRLQDAIYEDVRELLDEIREFYQHQSGQSIESEHPKENQMLGFINLLLAVSDSPDLLRMSDSGMVKRYQALLDQKSKSPKLDELEVICREQIESGNKKIVIFTQFARMQQLIVKRLEEKIGRCVIINGTMKPADRQAAIDQFWYNDEVYFLVATDAANYGINLQCANMLINVDLPWNPAVEAQRAGRIRRIGSQFNTVRVINLITEGGIDERIEQALYRKRQLASQIVEKNAEERQIINKLSVDLMQKLIGPSRKRSKRKTG